jgi:ParB family chromosome partitioning protein
MAKRKSFGISKALNEGISQTINAVKNNAGQLRYEVIPLTKIQFDPENPRKLTIKPEELLLETVNLEGLPEGKKKELDSLRSLAASIKKTGVRHAIEVYKDGADYRLISGERRVLGSILAGKEDIQARVLDLKPSEFDIRYLQWIENIEREDLSIWERLQNVRQLITTYSQLYATEVSPTSLKEILGCSLPHAMTYLAILNAPADIQGLLQTNQLQNLEKAAFLAKVESDSLRSQLIGDCIGKNASLASLKKRLAHFQELSKQIKQSSKQTKGRAAKRVTLGFTNNIHVVKKLFELIIEDGSWPEAKSFQVDWNDYQSVSKGFQLLIKLLETKPSHFS